MKSCLIQPLMDKTEVGGEKGAPDICKNPGVEGDLYRSRAQGDRRRPMSQSMGASQPREYGQLLANGKEKGPEVRYNVPAPLLCYSKHGTSREQQDFLNG